MRRPFSAGKYIAGVYRSLNFANQLSNTILALCLVTLAYAIEPDTDMVSLPVGHLSSLVDLMWRRGETFLNIFHPDICCKVCVDSIALAVSAIM